MNKYFTLCIIIVNFCLLGEAFAQAGVRAESSACFTQAETYYEQMYCEIKATGQGVSLPSFIDFKKNNEQMQALLLKRKAEALNIPFTMPNKKNAVSKKIKKLDAPAVNVHANDCQYLARTIKCADGIFYIVGNKSNSLLNSAALGGENKLGLNKFEGDPNNKTEILQYLTKSYTRYIEKMLEIGLAGATMSFTKFYYLFQDLSNQGVNFEQRFETMYAYLKVDKRSLGVTEDVIVIQDITMTHCNRLNYDLFTCDNGKNNRVYAR